MNYYNRIYLLLEKDSSDEIIKSETTKKYQSLIESRNQEINEWAPAIVAGLRALAGFVARSAAGRAIGSAVRAGWRRLTKKADDVPISKPTTPPPPPVPAPKPKVSKIPKYAKELAKEVGYGAAGSYAYDKAKEYYDKKNSSNQDDADEKSTQSTYVSGGESDSDEPDEIKKEKRRRKLNPLATNVNANEERNFNMNYIQRIHDLLVEAQINEAKTTFLSPKTQAAGVKMMRSGGHKKAQKFLHKAASKAGTSLMPKNPTPAQRAGKSGSAPQNKGGKPSDTMRKPSY
jgi:hypothetical protein